MKELRNVYLYIYLNPPYIFQFRQEFVTVTISTLNFLLT